MYAAPFPAAGPLARALSRPHATHMRLIPRTLLRLSTGAFHPGRATPTWPRWRHRARTTSSSSRSSAACATRACLPARRRPCGCRHVSTTLRSPTRGSRKVALSPPHPPPAHVLSFIPKTPPASLRLPLCVRRAFTTRGTRAASSAARALAEYLGKDRGRAALVVPSPMLRALEVCLHEDSCLSSHISCA